jgi:DNA-binding NtrC family response regulator
MKCSDFTLLFAEDNKGIQKIYKKAFAKEGYQVLTCENASQALAELREAKVDLLVTDLEMPQANTFELFPALKKEFPRLPVIVVTGHYQGLKDEFLAKGYNITEFLNKPLLVEDLKKKIRAILKIDSK